MLPSPPAVVAASRTVLTPALSCTVTVRVAHVVHPLVAANAIPAWATDPLTLTSPGRFVPLPLAYRNARVAVPAAVAFTVKAAALPMAFDESQKPLPEKP